VCKPDAAKGEKGPIVACLMAQIAPGKPGAWCKPYGIDPLLDDAASRLRYFKSALDALVTKITELGSSNGAGGEGGGGGGQGIKTVAFPCLIGCGLAGGSWSDYQAAIDEFAQRLLPDVRVFIYKL
jgi:hypothetical protein